jgi:hypothetical protein
MAVADILKSNPKTNGAVQLQEEIIDKGGMIFYAKYNDSIVGTVSLIKMNDTEFELSKMAVTDGVQGPE